MSAAPPPPSERHLVVTRFAVPRPLPGTAETFRDPAWIEERLALFRRFFVPSVGRTGVPAVLLCGSSVAGGVADQVTDLPWARVEVQDDWHGGWSDPRGRTLTRLDSDDALHAGWFEAVDRAPADARVLVTEEFLRWDLASGRLHRYRRREPSPLAAFRGGANPYEADHKHLGSADGVHRIDGAYLLQVVHDGNVSNRRPRAWRLDRRVSPRRLADFGLERAAARDTL